MKGGIFEGNEIDEAMVKKLATLPTRRGEDGGLYAGEVIDAAMVKKLASLPTREEALSILVGTFNSVLPVDVRARARSRRERRTAPVEAVAEEKSEDSA